MMDFAAVDASVRNRIQAIALRQEVLQRSLLRFKEFSCWPVLRLKNGTGRAWMRTLAFILNPAIDFAALHTRIEIEQMKGQPSRRHGYTICSIKAEEPNAGLALCRDIGPNIYLRKRREPWHRRRPA